MDKKSAWMILQWKPICFGVCVSIIATMVLTGAFAGLVSKQLLEENSLSYIALGIVMVSSFTGAGIAGKGGGGVNQLAVSMLYWVVLLAINAVLYDGNLKGMLPTLAAIIGGGGAAIIILRKGSNYTKHRYRKYRHR